MKRFGGVRDQAVGTTSGGLCILLVITGLRAMSTAPAAAVTRAQQLRASGLAVPPSAFDFRPRPLS